MHPVSGGVMLKIDCFIGIVFVGWLFLLHLDNTLHYNELLWWSNNFGVTSSGKEMKVKNHARCDVTEEVTSQYKYSGV